MGKEYKYRAFISYSHNDKAFVKWLHKHIENYKIPKSLREKYPHLPKNLKRSIFRDEEELPTSSVLGDNLKYALDHSQKLIVICSPSAVQSKWVTEEIRYFKEVHGEYSVLAILKDGVPKASSYEMHDDKEEAFPKSLRYEVGEDGKLTDKETEPLAGDAREGNDKEMALMKLIAGVLGIDFADLWEREKREAKKRKIIKTIFTLLFIGISFFAYQNYVQKVQVEKEKIEIQANGKEYVSLVEKRNELKRLVNLAKTDDEKVSLWIKIDKVNKRLKIVEEIDKNLAKVQGEITKKAVEIYQKNEKDGAKKALEFLDSEAIQKQEEKSVKLLSERWMIKANMNILENHYAKAEEFYEKAIGIDFSYNNALEYGNFLNKQNHHTRAIEIYEKLQKHKFSKEKKSAVLNNLGLLYNTKNELEKAEEAYKEALKLSRALAQKNPSAYTPNVARTLNNLANLYNFKVNKITEAEQMYLEVLELSPNNDVAMINLGLLYVNAKKYNQAIKLFTKLINLKPKEYLVGFINLYELQIIMNEEVNSTLENSYIKGFSQDKHQFMSYELLKIIKNITENKEVDISTWQKKYQGMDLNWNLERLQTWAETLKDEKIKKRIYEALEIFEKYQ